MADVDRSGILDLRRFIRHEERASRLAERVDDIEQLGGLAIDGRAQIAEGAGAADRTAAAVDIGQSLEQALRHRAQVRGGAFGSSVAFERPSYIWSACRERAPSMPPTSGLR